MGRQKWLADKVPLLNCDADSHGLFTAAEDELEQVETPSKKEVEIKKNGGISWMVAAFFIVADIAGMLCKEFSYKI